MADSIMHTTELIGVEPGDMFWHCTCGAVYPVGTRHSKIKEVQVILFKDSGKYYTEEYWPIPDGAVGPYDMVLSEKFRRIGNGPVLIPSQEPWGFPHLFPGEAQ